MTDDLATEDPLMEEVLDILRACAAYIGWVEERGTRPPHCSVKSEEIEGLFDRFRYDGYRIVRVQADAEDGGN